MFSIIVKLYAHLYRDLSICTQRWCVYDPINSMCNDLCVPRDQVQPTATLIGELLIKTFDDKDEEKKEEKMKA